MNSDDKQAQNSPKLICLDWDETMVKGHMHSDFKMKKIEGAQTKSDHGVYISSGSDHNTEPLNSKYNDQEVRQAATEFVKDKQNGFRDPEAQAEYINEQVAAGNKIAITSFSHYPGGIEAALDVLKEYGLTEEARKSIVVVTGFPSNGITSSDKEGFLGKSEHIKAAQNITGIKDNANVVLIDDSVANCKHATAPEQGYKAVVINPHDGKGAFAEAVREADKQLNAPPKPEVQKEVTAHKEGDVITIKSDRPIDLIPISTAERESIRARGGDDAVVGAIRPAKQAMEHAFKGEGYSVDYNSGQSKITVHPDKNGEIRIDTSKMTPEAKEALMSALSHSKSIRPTFEIPQKSSPTQPVNVDRAPEQRVAAVEERTPQKDTPTLRTPAYNHIPTFPQEKPERNTISTSIIGATLDNLQNHRQELKRLQSLPISGILKSSEARLGDEDKPNKMGGVITEKSTSLLDKIIDRIKDVIQIIKEAIAPSSNKRDSRDLENTQTRDRKINPGRSDISNRSVERGGRYPSTVENAVRRMSESFQDNGITKCIRFPDSSGFGPPSATPAAGRAGPSISV